jgi:hypothetical protein
VDAGGAADEGAGLRTAKSCGPDASTPASSQRSNAADDGDKQARSPGRARRKPFLRRECRVNSVYLAVTTLVCFVLFRTRGCGCDGHPAFPAPSVIERRKSSCIARAHRVARMRRCVLIRATSLRGAQRRSNPLLPLLRLWIASLRSQ